MRRSRRLAAFAAFFLALFVSATVSAACNQQLAYQCRQAYIQCLRSSGGDVDGQCEAQYNQCLQSAGCPIP